MNNVFAFLFAIIKAVPIINNWVNEFISYYTYKQIENMKEADWDAIRKAIDEHDQRKLEKQIGDKTPGEKSNLPGTIIRDRLPHVNFVQDSDKTRDRS